MTRDGMEIARDLLDRLEAGIAAHDLPAVTGLCTGEVVLFGTARANFGPEEVGRYLGLVVQANSIRWLLDRSAVVHQDDEHLLVAGSGRVEFDEGDGPEHSDFRLSLWLVREGDDWKIGHFHGSIPAT